MVPEPAGTDQATDVDCPAVVPVTLALKVTLAPVRMDVVAGVTVTAMTGAAVTVTLAVPVPGGVATLVAVTT